MSSYVYDKKIPELKAPAILKKDSYKDIRDAVTELQKHSLTGASSPDDSLTLLVQGNELQVSLSGEAGTGGKCNYNPVTGVFSQAGVGTIFTAEELP